MEVGQSPDSLASARDEDCLVPVVDDSTVIEISADWTATEDPLMAPSDSDTVKSLLDLTVKPLPEAVEQNEALPSINPLHPFHTLLMA